MKIIKSIWNVFSTMLVAVVLLVAVALAGIRLFGLSPYVVLSGSMEPTFRTGSIVYVKEVDPADLEAGDIITFSLDEDLIATHRIVEIVNDGSSLSFRTKGDANDVADGRLVREPQIVGQALFSIPRLGELAEFIHTTEGRRAAIAIGIAVVLLVSVPDMIFSEIEKKRSAKAAEQIQNEQTETPSDAEAEDPAGTDGGDAYAGAAPGGSERQRST